MKEPKTRSCSASPAAERPSLWRQSSSESTGPCSSWRTTKRSPQLYQEFKSFFPHNAIEYFVSYYDYYQPEAYIPSTDTFIEKESTINEEIDRLRLSATR